MRKVLRIGRKGKSVEKAAEVLRELEQEKFLARVALIQALIPLGLKHVEDLLEQEVKELAGEKWSRRGGVDGHVRWGSQPGSIYLGDQKLPIEVPRVRDQHKGQEVALRMYQGLQEPRRADEGVVLEILRGLSCRDYRECMEAVPQAFGLSASTMSRRMRRATLKSLRALQERELEEYDIVAMVVDGKSFAEDGMVVAVGITIEGRKVFLGFVQAGTENEVVCGEFFERLVERGLKYEQGLLVVIDGSKGIRKAVEKVFGKYALVQRCQWHKRENVLKYLPKSQQAEMRRKLQRAYEKPTYGEAKAGLLGVKKELSLINQSAVTSLEEGFEETLTLHRLGLFKELGVSLKTTNCLENVFSLVGQRTDKVDRWRHSEQKQRWLAAALLDIEPKLRKIKGCTHLKTLRVALLRNIQGSGAQEQEAA